MTRKAKPYEEHMARRAKNIMDRGGGKGILARLETRHVPAMPDMTEPIEGAARLVKLQHVKPDPKQPRKTIDKARLKELSDSIKSRGVLEPVIVTYSEKDQVYYLVTGERRYRASKLAGLTAIPAIIQPSDYDERERLTDQLLENIQREALPPIEEARAIKTLMDASDLSQVKVAKKLGKPRTYIAELLGILRIPPKKLDSARHLAKRTLVEVSKAKTEKEQDELLSVALGSKSPLRETKKRRTKNTAPTFDRTRYKLDRYEGARVTVEIPEGIEASPVEVLKAALRQARKG